MENPGNDNEYSLSPEQERTLEVLKNSGLEEYVREISNNSSLATFDQQSEIPIPPALIPAVDEKVQIPEQVDATLELLTRALNDEFTGLEYPFCLFGNTTEGGAGLSLIEKIYFPFEEGDHLKLEVSFNTKKMDYVFNLMRTRKYGDTLIIGHTHPKVSQEVQDNLLTSKLPAEIKEKYGIREAGLNISLQDIHQLVRVREQLESDIRLLIMVIMYNGDKVLIEDGGGKLVRLAE